MKAIAPIRHTHDAMYATAAGMDGRCSRRLEAA